MIVNSVFTFMSVIYLIVLYNVSVKLSEMASTSDKFLISPITGEQIPADKIQEHMRIGTLIESILIISVRICKEVSQSTLLISTCVHSTIQLLHVVNSTLVIKSIAPCSVSSCRMPRFSALLRC